MMKATGYKQHTTYKRGFICAKQTGDAGEARRRVVREPALPLRVEAVHRRNVQIRRCGTEDS